MFCISLCQAILLDGGQLIQCWFQRRLRERRYPILIMLRWVALCGNDDSNRIVMLMVDILAITLCIESDLLDPSSSHGSSNGSCSLIITIITIITIRVVHDDHHCNHQYNYHCHHCHHLHHTDPHSDISAPQSDLSDHSDPHTDLSDPHSDLSDPTQIPIKISKISQISHIPTQISLISQSSTHISQILDLHSYLTDLHSYLTSHSDPTHGRFLIKQGNKFRVAKGWSWSNIEHKEMVQFRRQLRPCFREYIV